MVFAIYTRKSIYSDTSDSTKNQAKMCRDYVDMHFPGKASSFLVYEDEGATGANTDRPDLKRLMQDIELGSIDFLIVYQLDRLSRDVRDFSNIYAFLEDHRVQFISVKENIDTSTPIGKAMMYVSVVFAQMERETIATRVYDNMIGLSDSGWWVGGNPPDPYVRKRVASDDGKYHVTISLDGDKVPALRKMFDLFIDNHFSLQQFERHLRHAGVKTKNGKFYSTNQLHQLLTMPYCVQATTAVYDFYKAKGCIMSDRHPRESWDGTHGVMVYGRTTERNKKHQSQPPEKWRVCIGMHEPCIDAETWLAAQDQFARNIFDKTMHHPIPLLKGVLRCSCGRLMSLARKKKVDGSVNTWYYCPKQMRQGKEYCDRKQIKAELLDNKVLEIFNRIVLDPDVISDYIKNAPGDHANLAAEKKTILRQISAAECKINNLTESLSSNNTTAAAKYIIGAIEKLDGEIKQYNRRLAELQAEEHFCHKSDAEITEKKRLISDLVENFANFSPDERNAIARDIISECSWDGETLFVTL